MGTQGFLTIMQASNRRQIASGADLLVFVMLKTYYSTEREILKYHPDRKGNRDPERYSFGAVAKTKTLVQDPSTDA